MLSYNRCARSAISYWQSPTCYHTPGVLGLLSHIDKVPHAIIHQVCKVCYLILTKSHMLSYTGYARSAISYWQSPACFHILIHNGCPCLPQILVILHSRGRMVCYVYYFIYILTKSHMLSNTRCARSAISYCQSPAFYHTPWIVPSVAWTPSPPTRCLPRPWCASCEIPTSSTFLRYPIISIRITNNE
jgi:hypothetical protein